MVAAKKKLGFTEGKIFFKLLWFVLPIVATNLLQSLYNAADMMVVSLSDETNAVGAVGTTGSFIHLIVNVFIGFSVGANVVVARHIGANDEERKQKAVHTALILGLLFGVGGAAVGIAVSRPVLVAMGNIGNLLDLAVKYTYFYFAGVPFLALLIKLKKDGDFSFKELKMDKRSIKDIVFIGFPAAIQGALISVSNMLIQSSIVTVNNNVCPPDSTYQPVVNGCAAGSNLSNFVYTAQNAVYQGAITFTGQNIGANKPKRVYRIIGCCCILTTAIGASLAVSIFLCRAPLLALYGVTAGAEGSLEALAMDAATTQLMYVCLPYFLCGIMEVGSGVLRGMGRSVLSMVIMLLGSVFLRVVWLLTVFPLYPTLDMVYICYPVTWILSSIAMFICAFLVISKKIRYGRNG